MTRGYSVRRENGCIVIDGWIPVTDIAALTRAWEIERGGKHASWIFDSLLSSHLSCNFVVGPVEACMAWRERLGIVAEGPPWPRIDPVNKEPT